jgi:CheY-like chemotaxis protein
MTMEEILLFWSRKGEVACGAHAPAADSARWASEGWQPVPEVRRPIRYQCQFCGQSPVKHVRKRLPETPLILNVDDNEATLYSRDRILRSHGFDVANAGTGRAAFDAAQRLRPHLVLLDVHLPDADGRELCKRLKADSELADTAVVLISSTLSGHVDQLETVRYASADAFIREPVDAQSLISTLLRVLQNGTGRVGTGA